MAKPYYSQNCPVSPTTPRPLHAPQPGSPDPKPDPDQPRTAQARCNLDWRSVCYPFSRIGITPATWPDRSYCFELAREPEEFPYANLPFSSNRVISTPQPPPSPAIPNNSQFHPRAPIAISKAPRVPHSTSPPFLTFAPVVTTLRPLNFPKSLNSW
ncbi:hypothetical protein PCASD_19473 [Puccinia coronata f. sp. avenae]|uniref:Uncharacterized protein n=1 Tax=Puccinia coronata f. sp. avenae TaxID=200324 RepID=A0A2N5UAF9_9BASI|nr:hypothetical protein PCASD_19473 [Puccinia coronata f. sp. avenae]